MPPTVPAKKKGLHRRLYDWVIHWADTKYALPALIVLSFAESSFFPIPPDVLLLPLCLGDPRKAFRFAFWCSLASVLGGMLGYYIGFGLWAWLQDFFFEYVPGFTEENFGKVKAWFEDWDFWAVFVAGFSPIPYKVITIAAGVFSINFAVFVIASVVSRSARFFIEAALLRIWGEPIRNFVEKRLGLMSLLFCVVLVGGFVAIKYLL